MYVFVQRQHQVIASKGQPKLLQWTDNLRKDPVLVSWALLEGQTLSPHSIKLDATTPLIQKYFTCHCWYMYHMQVYFRWFTGDDQPPCPAEPRSSSLWDISERGSCSRCTWVLFLFLWWWFKSIANDTFFPHFTLCVELFFLPWIYHIMNNF